MKRAIVNIGGTRYYIREATRGELYNALSIGDEWEGQDYLISVCTIYPENIKPANMLAGEAEQLVNAIYKLSGIDPEISNELQQKGEDWALSLAGKIDALLMAVLHIQPSEIKNLTTEEWYRLAAQAQLMAVFLYGLDVDKLISLTREEIEKATAQKSISKNVQTRPPRI